MNGTARAYHVSPDHQALCRKRGRPAPAAAENEAQFPLPSALYLLERAGERMLALRAVHMRHTYG